MKVKIGNRVYYVEFPTEAKRPKYGKDKDHKVLVETGCIISRNGSKGIISRAFATQNYRDKLNWNAGRKFSLARALKKTKFKKEIRSAFWNSYKDEYSIRG